ncbi:hypothetical protein WA158_000296 [Blastocystis sp. Blastoise]
MRNSYVISFAVTLFLVAGSCYLTYNCQKYSNKFKSSNIIVDSDIHTVSSFGFGSFINELQLNIHETNSSMHKMNTAINETITSISNTNQTNNPVVSLASDIIKSHNSEIIISNNSNSTILNPLKLEVLNHSNPIVSVHSNISVITISNRNAHRKDHRQSASLFYYRHRKLPQRNVSAYKPPSIETTYPLFYGALSYGYLNGTIPPLYQEIDIAQPADLYKGLDINYIQSYHYQLSSEEDPSVQTDQPYIHRYYEFPSTRHFSFYSFPKFENPKHPFDGYMMVGFIKTHWKRNQNRNVIRSTYLDFNKAPILKNRFKLFFVIALSYDKSQIPILLKEQETYNDLIILNTIDTYNNLTLKTLMMEDLFVALNSTTPYYMSIDDDVCVDLYAIYRFLSSRIRRNLYIGSILKEMPTKTLNTKHSIPFCVLPKRIRFAFGPAYIMSRDVVNCHVQYIRMVNGFYHVDDAFVGYLSKLCGIQVHSLGNWMGQGQNMVGHSKEFVSRGYYVANGLGRADHLNEVCASVYTRKASLSSIS